MLRLWPDLVRIGLFPGSCWLDAPQESIAGSAEATDPAAPAASLPLVSDLNALLDQLGPRLKSGSRITLTVSDSVAAIVAMPWQEQLQQHTEIAHYARICFEAQGRPLNDDWVMSHALREYRALGLAYAFPREWLATVEATIVARKLVLASVLPLSVAAYSYLKGLVRGRRRLVLLREPRRAVALVYSGRTLLSYDTEPGTSDRPQPLQRLLHRVHGYHAEIDAVLDWSTEVGDPVAATSLITACYPRSRLEAVSRRLWG